MKRTTRQTPAEQVAALLRQIERTAPTLRAELLRIFDGAAQNGTDTAHEQNLPDGNLYSDTAREYRAAEQRRFADSYGMPWTFDDCRHVVTLASICWCADARATGVERRAIQWFARRGLV